MELTNGGEKSLILVVDFCNILKFIPKCVIHHLGDLVFVPICDIRLWDINQCIEQKYNDLSDKDDLQDA